MRLLLIYADEGEIILDFSAGRTISKGALREIFSNNLQQEITRKTIPNLQFIPLPQPEKASHPRIPISLPNGLPAFLSTREQNQQQGLPTFLSVKF